MEFGLPIWRQGSIEWRGMFPSQFSLLKAFHSQLILLLLLLHPPQKTWGLGHERERRKKKYPSGFLHFLCTLGVPFSGFEPELEGFSCISLPAQVVLTSGFWVVLSAGWGILEGKNGKLTAS